MDIKQDLIRHYRWLRHYGINDSHSGNASVRKDKTIWVTPTGACADTLSSDELVACNLKGHRGEGASLDAALHLAVYEQNPTARAVLHSHGAYTVALTMNGKDFIPPDFEGQYYFPRVPVITISYGRYLDEAPQKVAEVLAEYPITVVRGHGIYSQAESINLAYKWTCSLEQSAKTAFIAKQAGALK